MQQLCVFHLIYFSRSFCDFFPPEPELKIQLQPEHELSSDLEPQPELEFENLDYGLSFSSKLSLSISLCPTLSYESQIEKAPPTAAQNEPESGAALQICSVIASLI